MKVIAIVQARMGSSRLPGKVLLPVSEQTILSVLVSRLANSETIDQVVVATTLEVADNAIVDACELLGVDVYRGSQNDVQSRYLDVAHNYSADIIVRITADCPLVDPNLVDDCVRKLTDANLDYVSNCNGVKHAIADGFDVEVFTLSALVKARKLSLSNSFKEHVTFAFFKTKFFEIGCVEYSHDFGELRLTVDYPEDYELLLKVVSNIGVYADWRTISSFLVKNPDIKSINGHILRNASWEISLTDDGVIVDTFVDRDDVIANSSGLLSKRADQFAPDLWPENYLYAKGQTIYTSKGETYLDYSIGGIGATTLGFSNDFVDERVIKQIKRGSASSLNPEVELEASKKLISLIPWLQKVRYTRSGGEANALAVRLGRASSGRDKVLFCGYHGWHDWYLAAAFKNKMGNHLLDELPIAGVPKALSGSAIPFEYGDIEKFIKLVENNPDTGTVILEPMRYTEPDAKFLTQIRDICVQRGIVLIFDEISCGFRFNNSAVHLDIDVIPDIVIFSKAIGNGYPIACVAGSDRVMSASKMSFISSTTHTESIGFSAMSAVLDVYSTSDVAKELAKRGGTIKQYLKDCANTHELNISIKGLDALWSWSFDTEGSQNRAMQTYITQSMLRDRILFCNRFYSTLGIDPAFDDYFKKSLNSAMCKLAEELRSGRPIAAALSGPVNRLGQYS